MKISPELRDWLAIDHPDLEQATTSVREAVPVVEHVATLVRPLRARRVEVGTAVVFHDGSGRPFVAVHDGRVLVCRRDAPGLLDVETVADLDGWIAVDPWPSDIGFRRGTDVLRELLAGAFTR